MSVSDMEDSGFCFETSQDHNCEDITKSLVHVLIYLLTSLLELNMKIPVSSAANNECSIKMVNLSSVLSGNVDVSD